MPHEPSEPRDPGAFTVEEAGALGLAEELRDRIQRERETARRLGDYLEVTATVVDSPAVGEAPGVGTGPAT